MGRREDDFAQLVAEIVQRHAPDFSPRTLEMRTSRNGRYLSLTVTINAASREQLDALYTELSRHPMVMMVL
jgi:putative lipoic acid-binding regulatory protein